MSGATSAVPAGKVTLLARAAPSAPGASARSMRVRSPSRSSRHWAAAMSMTPSTSPSRGPGTRPAIRSPTARPPACTVSVSPGPTPKRVAAVGVRKRPSSSSPPAPPAGSPPASAGSVSRPSPSVVGCGSRPGVSGAARNQSMPRIVRLSPLAPATGTRTSSTGLAIRTSGEAASGPNTASPKPSREPARRRSALPASSRVAEPNSRSAASLTRLTPKPRATPAAMARASTAVRQRCRRAWPSTRWRSSQPRLLTRRRPAPGARPSGAARGRRCAPPARSG